LRQDGHDAKRLWEYEVTTLLGSQCVTKINKTYPQSGGRENITQPKGTPIRDFVRVAANAKSTIVTRSHYREKFKVGRERKGYGIGGKRAGLGNSSP